MRVKENPYSCIIYTVNVLTSQNYHHYIFDNFSSYLKLTHGESAS